MRAWKGRFSKGVLALALALGVSTPAAAHQLWLEAAAPGAKLYFGEFADQLREISPGYLDKLARPTATLLSPKGQKQLPVVKEKNGYAISGQLAGGDALIVVDEAYPLLEAKEGDQVVHTLWTPAARYVTRSTAQTPKLTLDIVPTGVSGEFQVFYQGKPLADATLTLSAAFGWSREETSDAAGKVHFNLPWKTRYGLLVRHKDEHAGSRRGAHGNENYDRASFATTLSFATSSGLAAPPMPPPAPPNAMPAH